MKSKTKTEAEIETPHHHRYWCGNRFEKASRMSRPGIFNRFGANAEAARMVNHRSLCFIP